MPRKYQLVLAISAIIATAITYLTLQTKKCAPGVLDCISGKYGGFPLKFRTLEGGTLAYINTNYFYFSIDWLLFFLILAVPAIYILKQLEKFGVKFPPEL